MGSIQVVIVKDLFESKMTHLEEEIHSRILVRLPFVLKQTLECRWVCREHCKRAFALNDITAFDTNIILISFFESAESESILGIC